MGFKDFGVNANLAHGFKDDFPYGRTRDPLSSIQGDEKGTIGFLGESVPENLDIVLKGSAEA
jgi:hypothetical protein